MSTAVCGISRQAVSSNWKRMSDGRVVAAMQLVEAAARAGRELLLPSGCNWHATLRFDFDLVQHDYVFITVRKGTEKDTPAEKEAHDTRAEQTQRRGFG